MVEECQFVYDVAKEGMSKAITHLEDVHLAQALNYLEAYQMPIGLLLNFGAKSLEFKRLHNNKLLKSSSNPSIT